MEFAQYLDSVFLGIVIFFLLYFVEDMLGINQTIRIILAVIAAFAHHNYGHMLAPAIASVLAIFGLNPEGPDL